MQTDPKQDYERGFVPFLDQKIFLDSRPLIPRTETEYWVERALTSIPTDTPITVLDLFAGSGCIGIAVLGKRPLSSVVFAEKEARHLPTIQKSIEENGIQQNRATLVASDVWSNVSGSFDFIFANPPYISKERMSVDLSVVEHEPEEALYAPDDGFFFITQTISGLEKHLKQKGVCFIEHEPFQTQRISEEAALYGLASETYPDQYGILRYSRLTCHMA